MFNWLGKKEKYFGSIEHLLNKFKIVIDPMMGSAAILTKLKGKEIIGNDIIKLVPTILNKFDTFDVSIETFKNVCNSFNNFSKKSDYYDFRTYWNLKYTTNNFDSIFLVETFLLFKMCSNSVIRFNKSDNFNSGFRGVIEGTPFFKNNDFSKYSKGLSEIKMNGKFYVEDVIVFLERDFDFENSIFILDPPYVLSNGAFAANSYTIEKEKVIYDFILNNNANFIFFNFMRRNGIEHTDFINFAKDFNTTLLSTKSCTGQNRNGTSSVSECFVTNLD
jgi:site-specific DNA-adenine methylase